MVVALTYLHIAILFIASTVFVAAAVNDVLSYRIPNYLCALLLALFPIYVATAPYPVDWIENIPVGLAVLAGGFLIFLKGFMGAGDIKLLAVASLWAGPQWIGSLLFVMAIVGGVEALVMVVALRLNLPKDRGCSSLVKAQIPYGFAIAAGGISVLGLMSLRVLLPG